MNVPHISSSLKAIRAVEKFILTYGMICLAVITVGNVVSRRGFNYSWAFTEEISQFIMVIITFMGLSHAARKARHIRMTAVYDLMNDKIKKVMMITLSSVTLVTLFYLAYEASVYVLQVKEFGKVTPTLRVPFYLLIIWAPIGFFLGGIEYLLTLIKNLRHQDVWLSYDEKSEYSEV